MHQLTDQRVLRPWATWFFFFGALYSWLLYSLLFPKIATVLWALLAGSVQPQTNACQIWAFGSHALSYFFVSAWLLNGLLRLQPPRARAFQLAAKRLGALFHSFNTAGYIFAGLGLLVWPLVLVLVCVVSGVLLAGQAYTTVIKPSIRDLFTQPANNQPA